MGIDTLVLLIDKSKNKPKTESLIDKELSIPVDQDENFAEQKELHMKEQLKMRIAQKAVPKKSVTDNIIDFEKWKQTNE